MQLELLVKLPLFLVADIFYGLILQDDSGVKNEDAKQDFVRNTKK